MARRWFCYARVGDEQCFAWRALIPAHDDPREDINADSNTKERPEKGPDGFPYSPHATSDLFQAAVEVILGQVKSSNGNPRETHALEEGPEEDTKPPKSRSLALTIHPVS